MINSRLCLLAASVVFVCLLLPNSAEAARWHHEQSTDKDTQTQLETSDGQTVGMSRNPSSPTLNGNHSSFERIAIIEGDSRVPTANEAPEGTPDSTIEWAIRLDDGTIHYYDSADDGFHTMAFEDWAESYYYKVYHLHELIEGTDEYVRVGYDELYGDELEAYTEGINQAEREETGFSEVFRVDHSLQDTSRCEVNDSDHNRGNARGSQGTITVRGLRRRCHVENSISKSSWRFAAESEITIMPTYGANNGGGNACRWNMTEAFPHITFPPGFTGGPVMADRPPFDIGQQTYIDCDNSPLPLRKVNDDDYTFGLRGAGFRYSSAKHQYLVTLESYHEPLADGDLEEYSSESAVAYYTYLYRPGLPASDQPISRKEFGEQPPGLQALVNAGMNWVANTHEGYFLALDDSVSGGTLVYEFTTEEGGTVTERAVIPSDRIPERGYRNIKPKNTGG